MTDHHADAAHPFGLVPAPGGGLSRRGLLGWTGLAGLRTAGISVPPGPTRPATASQGPPRAASSGFDPIRPPAVPLAVRSPYLSAWLPADTLAGSWPCFWTGRTTAMTGIARIDGVPFLFLGAPGIPDVVLRGMVQRSLTVTATRSEYVLEAAGVRLTLTFLSPVEPGDVRRQCVPLSYVTCAVRSLDGREHSVGLYFDVSGEWAHGDSGSEIGWEQERITGPASITSLSFSPSRPDELTEHGDMASWGTVVWNATEQPGLTWQIGADTVVRSAAVAHGRLGNTSDANQPRRINDNWPVFAFHFDLGRVGRQDRSALLSIGHVREPAVRYLGTPLPPLWKSYWTRWQDMASFFHADARPAQQRTAALDERIRREATALAGPKYAALCALALRQAYGGTELVSRDGQPWAFLKEISSDGNVSTVDVVYPAMPVFAYADPEYLGLLLAPLLDYPEHGGWPQTFAEHDLGSSYPDAAGHNDGKEEDMPVEESANMLIVSAAYLARTGKSRATAFAKAHYPILKRWADYLTANALDPGNQNQTDDFTGWIAHSANLALKGILGIGAMSQIATAAGNAADAARYRSTARDFIGQWAAKGQDAQKHLRLAYDQPGTWSLKYNGYPDRLLGLGLLPGSVAQEEADWYLGQVNQFGVPLDDRHAYTKGDWEMWTAAWLAGHPVSDYLVGALYDFVHTSPSRVPFTDWYDTVSNRQVGFQARPVVGGVFARLSLGR
ncbi:glutaminase domain-containing protein [Streptomyces sp. NPDC001848]|uniref:glutaminase family protein n=1 Tax=Streptomyces sp. NPDC001848 TaxID=3364618 RepID=UPI0036786262